MTLYEKKSLTTKNKLSTSLKKLMKKTEFQKISINDLVKDANLNRNSFYYHFSNIFDLLKYTFENDAIKILKKISHNYDVEKAVYFIMDYIDKNKSFCICAYKSLGKTELKKFLRNNFQDIITDVIDEIIKRNSFVISNDFKNYIVYSHTELMAAHIIGYLENEFKLPKTQIVNYILLIFNSSIISALKIANTNNL